MPRAAGCHLDDRQLFPRFSNQAASRRADLGSGDFRGLQTGAGINRKTVNLCAKAVRREITSVAAAWSRGKADALVLYGSKDKVGASAWYSGSRCCETGYGAGLYRRLNSPTHSLFP
jgi:hypothetical protein